MKTVKLEYLREIMEGCINNNYKSICQAGRLLDDLASGLKDIEVEESMKRSFKTSLYRKFMRAYTRYILANPNIINQMAIDCSFASMANEFVALTAHTVLNAQASGNIEEYLKKEKEKSDSFFDNLIKKYPELTKKDYTYKDMVFDIIELEMLYMER